MPPGALESLRLTITHVPSPFAVAIGYVDHAIFSGVVSFPGILVSIVPQLATPRASDKRIAALRLTAQPALPTESKFIAYFLKIATLSASQHLPKANQILLSRRGSRAEAWYFPERNEQRLWVAPASHALAKASGVRVCASNVAHAGHPRKVRFGAMPNPARGTRALPAKKWRVFSKRCEASVSRCANLFL